MTPGAFLSLSHYHCWFSQQEVIGTSLPGTEHWAGGPDVGLLLAGGSPSKPRYPSQFFNHHTLVLSQVFLHLCHFYQSQHGFFTSSVTGALFNHLSGGFE